jgi:hypothetical protein
LVRPGSLTVGNQGILLIISVLFLMKYIQALTLAGAEVAKGRPKSLERLLFAIGLAWLFPLLSSARLTVGTRALRHLPLSLKDLFLIKAGSLLLPPSAWMVVAGSLAIGFPLARSPRPLTGMLAALLYILISWLVGLTASQILSIPTLRRLIFWLLIAAFAVVAFYVAQADNPIASLSLITFSRASLVTSAAMGEATWVDFSLLLFVLAVSGLAALWTFKLSLEVNEQYRARRVSLVSAFAGKTGPLSAKDLRYFIRLLDPYFGILLSAVGCFYLLFADVRSPEVFWIFITLVLFPNASVAFNAFGLDTRHGLNRYALLPLSSAEIIRSKNVAFLVMVSLQLVPLFVLALWSLEFYVVILGIVETILLMLAYLIWGNLISISHRFQMQFFRFSSGGSPIDALVGVLFGTAPGAIAILLFGRRLWWITIAMVIIYSALYLLSLSWSGRGFNRIIEQT